MHIKVLLENSRLSSEYKKGHGLSLLINYAGEKYLFDTGPNKKLVLNASKMQESLADLKAVIISHGHSDHTGGLPFLDLATTPLYMAENADKPHYLKVLFSYLSVGMPKKGRAAYLEAASIVKNKLEIAPNFYVIPLGKANSVTENLYMEQAEGKVHDDFADELMLVFEEEDGLILFTGCSHHGIVEMVEFALRLFPDKAIKALIGGFHMIGIPYINNLRVSQEEVVATGKRLLELPINRILTCHCTGEKAFELLKQQLGDKLESISTGQQFEL